jgi:NADH dehydrogenase
MKINKVLLLGGSGFIGSAVAEQLTRQGIDITVPTRVAMRARHLLLLPTIDIVEADVHDPAQLAELVRGQDTVINLVGILHGDFERDHVELPRTVAAACAKAGVPRLLHMSALNADKDGPSEYLRSRGHGEAAVWSIARQNPGLAVTMFRPSVVFGEGDKFLNMFAKLVKVSPFIPLGSPDARFQPVWVEDVARAIAQSLTMRETFGNTYPLVGPGVYTLRQLLEFVMSATGKKRPILGLGSALSALQAAVFGHLPGKVITSDNLKSMSIPSTSDQPFPAIFGTAHALETIAAAYLSPDHQPGRQRYDQFRSVAGRAH